MKKWIAFVSLTVALSGVVPTFANEAKGKERREHRRKEWLDKKCNGDQKCEAELKEKFLEKKDEVTAEIEQKCGQDQVCRKEERQRIIREFKGKRAAQKQQNAGK